MAAPQLHRADAAVFSRLGPSFKCSNPRLLHTAWASEAWSAASLLVWVVDDRPSLEAMARLGVRDVISNQPLRMQRLARAMCERQGGGGRGLNAT